ncbi:MAG: sulfite exporter TauE/SafE family protein [Cytophagaceae bacterium]|jgi:hypothetical protein|nr:sulfite exporter TauE/SafE family protein [Cytophagaceae bacterium]
MNEPLTENDALVKDSEPSEISSGGFWVKKITRSDFGKRIFTRRLALVLGLLVVAGVLFQFVPGASDTGYAGLTAVLDIFTQPEFLLMVMIGFIAQMIDGALGMAYGASSNTMLLSAGIPSDVAIQSIKISEVFTTAASGFSHWRMGNVNKKLFKNLIVPGVIGAIAGSLLLVYIESLESFSKQYLKPLISVYILFLGVYLIFKANVKILKKKKTKKLRALAVTGGFFDAIGGGGWGPIVTSTLLSRGRNPKYTIGSVNLAEFFIAFAGAVTLTWAIGLNGWKVVAGLIVGGIIAAPFGAYIAQRVKTKPLMILVGTLIIIVNLWNIYKAYKNVYVVLGLIIVTSISVYVVVNYKRFFPSKRPFATPEE